MTWKDSTEIGAGKAVIQTGDQKGTLFVVCNYNPRGNMIGESPFPATGIGRGRDARNDDPEVAKLQAKVERLEKENAELRKAELAQLGSRHPTPQPPCQGHAREAERSGASVGCGRSRQAARPSLPGQPHGLGGADGDQDAGGRHDGRGGRKNARARD